MHSKLQYTWRWDYCECGRPARHPVITWSSSSVPSGTTSRIRSPLGPHGIQQLKQIWISSSFWFLYGMLTCLLWQAYCCLEYSFMCLSVVNYVPCTEWMKWICIVPLQGKWYISKVHHPFHQSSLENVPWSRVFQTYTSVNPLNAKLNPICHLLTLLGAHHILHVSRVRVNQ